MVSVDQINLKFDGCFSTGDKKDTTAKSVVNTAVDTLLSSLLSGGGSAELAASPARSAKSIADKVSSAQAINEKIQVCTAAVNGLMQLVQQGTVTLNQMMDFINNIVTTIKNNDTQAETLNSNLESLTEENKEILEQINELGGGDAVDESQNVDTDSNDNNNINNGNSVATPTFVNNNKKSGTSQKSGKTQNSKLQELIAKYQSNNQQIAMLQTTIAAIGNSNTQQIQAGETQQQTAQTTFTSITENVKNQATEQFNQLANELKNEILSGVTKQVEHSNSTSSYAKADKEAAQKTASHGLFKGVLGGVLGAVTGGAGLAAAGASVGKDASESAMFTTASGLNEGYSGAAKNFQTVIKNLGINVGTQIATKLTQSVNEQLGGNILSIANNIEGIDIKAQSIFDYSKFLNKGDDQKQV